MSIEIKNAVSVLLENTGIVYACRYVGLSENALGGTHAMDEWRITFSKDNKQSVFEFFTGIGLRAEPTPSAKMQARYHAYGVTDKDIRSRTIIGKRYLAHLETLRKPLAPHPADILHSLILDGTACEQSFSDWCSDFGYDDDSRKAFNTYEACQINTDKLRRVVDKKTISALSELLQDY